MEMLQAEGQEAAARAMAAQMECAVLVDMIGEACRRVHHMQQG